MLGDEFGGDGVVVILVAMRMVVVGVIMGVGLGSHILGGVI